MTARDPRDPVDPGEPVDPAAAPAATAWREEVVGASGLNLLAGIWLLISPFVLNFRTDDPVWNPVVFGAIVALLALVRIAGAYRESWLSLVNAAIGVWVFVSAFWLAKSGVASADAFVMGAIIFLLALWSVTASESGRRARMSAARRRT